MESDPKSQITTRKLWLFWGCHSSAKRGRPALILSEDESVVHGRRAEVSYKIRKGSVQTHVGQYRALNVLAYREHQSVILHLPAH
jgi:hypothetical protein